MNDSRIPCHLSCVKVIFLRWHNILFVRIILSSICAIHAILMIEWNLKCYWTIFSIIFSRFHFKELILNTIWVNIKSWQSHPLFLEKNGMYLFNFQAIVENNPWWINCDLWTILKLFAWFYKRPLAKWNGSSRSNLKIVLFKMYFENNILKSSDSIGCWHKSHFFPNRWIQFQSFDLLNRSLISQCVLQRTIA